MLQASTSSELSGRNWTHFQFKYNFLKLALVGWNLGFGAKSDIVSSRF
jgi:hypothetical protein